MKNAEMIARLRKAGDCYVPVIANHDVVHVMVKKADLIDRISDWPAADDCPWYIVADHGDHFYIDAE